MAAAAQDGMELAGKAGEGDDVKARLMGLQMGTGDGTRITPGGSGENGGKNGEKRLDDVPSGDPSQPGETREKTTDEGPRGDPRGTGENRESHGLDDVPRIAPGEIPIGPEKKSENGDDMGKMGGLVDDEKRAQAEGGLRPPENAANVGHADGGPRGKPSEPTATPGYLDFGRGLNPFAGGGLARTPAHQHQQWRNPARDSGWPGDAQESLKWDGYVETYQSTPMGPGRMTLPQFRMEWDGRSEAQQLESALGRVGMPQVPFGQYKGYSPHGFGPTLGEGILAAPGANDPRYVQYIAEMSRQQAGRVPQRGSSEPEQSRDDEENALNTTHDSNAYARGLGTSLTGRGNPEAGVQNYTFMHATQ